MIRNFKNEDDQTNSNVAFGLATLNAVETLPLIRKVFEAEAIDETYAGGL